MQYFFNNLGWSLAVSLVVKLLGLYALTVITH